MAESETIYTEEIFSASDGYRCIYRHYPALSCASQQPRAHLVCVHGIQSHAGWYEYSCTKLSQAGFNVFFLNRRGAGPNEQARGDSPNFRRLLDDLGEFLRFVPNKNEAQSSLPVFLLAISWGGKLAMALQRHRPGEVDGIVLLCPGFFPRVKPSLAERLGIALSRLVSPGRLFPIPLSSPELFTANPRWQEYIRDDALGLRQATARFFVSSVFLDRYLRSAPEHVKVPVLLLLAENDRIIDNAATRRFVEQFASPDKQIIEYPGASHTLEFEQDPDPFIMDIDNWLNRHGHKGSP